MMFDMEKVNEMEHAMGKNAKKPKDVNAPSRALSAYFLWANKMRPEVMKSCSGVAEIGKKLGQMWKKVSSSDRAPWEAKYQKAKKTYDSKMEKYKKSSSYQKHQMMMQAWKIHETKKPYMKDPNAPKRNLSAYMLYAASVRSNIVKENPEMEVTDIMREQSVWWKSLGDGDRKKWADKAAAGKAKYAKKVERYMKTNDYQTYVTGRDAYKAEMLAKRNKLMGIKKRSRSVTKAKGAKSPSKKKQKKRTSRRSRTPKASKSRRRSSSKKKRSSSRRSSRTPKAPKKSKSRSTSRSSSRRRSRRRGRVSRTPKASRRNSSSKKRSSSRRRASTPKAPKRSKSRSKSRARRSRRRRASKTPKASKSRSKSRKSSRSKSKTKSKSPKRRKSASRSKSRRRSSSRRKSARRRSRKRRARKAKHPKKKEMDAEVATE